MGDGGKGSRVRPAQVDKETLAKNWEMIFGKKPSCLDAAYEREAMRQGLVDNPAFPENKGVSSQTKQKRQKEEDLEDLGSAATKLQGCKSEVCCCTGACKQQAGEES